MRSRGGPLRTGAHLVLDHEIDRLVGGAVADRVERITVRLATRDGERVEVGVVRKWASPHGSPACARPKRYVQP